MEQIVGVAQLYFMPHPLLEIVQRLMAHPVLFSCHQTETYHKFLTRFQELWNTTSEKLFSHCDSSVLGLFTFC